MSGRRSDEQNHHSTAPHMKKARQAAFLAAYAETGNVSAAARAAGVDRSAHYRWSAEDEKYKEAYEQAHEAAVDVLEAEARRRAVEGFEEPVGWYKGEAGGVVRRYSDTLLIFLLKGAKPDKYADRTVVRGAIARLDVTRLPPHLLARIADGENPYAVLASAVEGSGELLQLGPGDPNDSGENDKTD